MIQCVIAAVMWTLADGGADAQVAPAGGPAADRPPLTGKKVLMVIAPKDFRDEELFVTRGELEKQGARISVASETQREAQGVLGGKVKPDLALKDVKAEEYDAVVFVGGPGAKAYYDDAQCHKIAQAAVKHEKVTAAICIAPCILAKAGVLKGVKATVWPSPATKAILREGGATCVEKHVVQDGRVVTADGPESAKGFGETLVKVLAGG